MSHIILAEIEIALMKSDFEQIDKDQIQTFVNENKCENFKQNQSSATLWLQATNTIDYTELKKLYNGLKTRHSDLDITALEYSESGIAFNNGELVD